MSSAVDSKPGGRAAEYLARKAEEYEASVVGRIGDTLIVEVDLRRADGRIVPYRLSIDAEGTVPFVREQTPDRLPAACPQRHINADSTFCMNWQIADPVVVRSLEDAADWWGRLLAYLRLQERAAMTGRWPGPQWAHGELAARYQLQAERSASDLGETLVHALSIGHLNIGVRPLGKPSPPRFLRVYNKSRRLYSVWEQERRLVTQRQLCVCGSGLAMKSCGTHAASAVALAVALREQPVAEAGFWKLMQQQPCCRTMIECPLAANSNTRQAKIA